jgi:hypothetical protein
MQMRIISCVNENTPQIKRRLFEKYFDCCGVISTEQETVFCRTGEAKEW